MKKLLMVVGASALLAGCNMSWLPVPQARLHSQTYTQEGANSYAAPRLEVGVTTFVNNTAGLPLEDRRYQERTRMTFGAITGRFYTLAGSLGVRINQMQVEMLVNNVSVYKTPLTSVRINVNSGFRCPKQDALVISGPGEVPDCVYADKDTSPGDSVDARIVPTIPLFSDSKLSSEIAKMVYFNNPNINTTGAPNIVGVTTQLRITYSGVDTNLNAFSHSEITFLQVNVKDDGEVDVTPPKPTP